MTKKDYVTVANALKRVSPSIARNACVYELADAFAKDNPNFKRSVFFKACGLTHTEIDWITSEGKHENI